MKNLLFFFCGLLLLGCKENRTPSVAPESSVVHPEWAQSAVIYEVNIRQYTPEGTFRAFEAHLPRLQELGVDILWLMPIHPIGLDARKGSLGSYYSVQDYVAINPEFGTLEDFTHLVRAAHDLGFKVIIDWVANHTARDAKWVSEHPDWYLRDSAGVMIAPFDWTDVAKLDYTNADMRAAMIESLRFWLAETGIDGFRCDVAAEVPVDFWDKTLAALRSEFPGTFFLAEAEEPALMLHAFDAYYAWNVHACMNALAQGKIGADSLARLLHRQALRFPENSIAMNFTSNHDENSWNGTEFERLGPAVRQFAVLSFLLPGMPLIYSGQEAGFDRRLEFFEKDVIDWSDVRAFYNFYAELISWRDNHPALYAPPAGASLQILDSDAPKEVFACIRSLGDDIVAGLFNFSDRRIVFRLKAPDFQGDWKLISGEGPEEIGTETIWAIEPWDYIIYEKASPINEER